MNEIVTINCQDLRNITTGKGHTGSLTDLTLTIAKLTTVYLSDFLDIIPALQIIQTILRTKNIPDRFWDGTYDLTHTGTITLKVFTRQERTRMLNYIDQYNQNNQGPRPAALTIVCE